MAFRALPPLLFAALILTFVGKLASIWPSLPERVATHFDFSGQPNGWSSKTELIVVVAGMLTIFISGFVSTRWLVQTPDHFLNVPGKAYWLAPERRTDTLAWLGSWIRWFVVVTFAFIGWVIMAALEANLAPPPRFIPPAWIIAAFTGLVAAMFGWIFWRLRTPG